MGALFRVLLLVGFVLKFWWLLVLLLVAAVVGWVAWCAQDASRAQLERRRRADAALVARADQQHAWVLEGMSVVCTATTNVFTINREKPGTGIITGASKKLRNPGGWHRGIGPN